MTFEQMFYVYFIGAFAVSCFLQRYVYGYRARKEIFGNAVAVGVISAVVAIVIHGVSIYFSHLRFWQ